MSLLNSVLPFLQLGCGAILGAWLRWGMTLWLNPRWSVVPLGTWLVNGIGAFVMGWVMAWFAKQPMADETWRLFLVTGFLGSFTTFSAFSAEIWGHFANGKLAWAIWVLMAHVMTACVAVGLGVLAYQWWVK